MRRNTDLTAVKDDSFGRMRGRDRCFCRAGSTRPLSRRKGRCGPPLPPHLTGSAGTPMRSVSSLGLRPSLAPLRGPVGSGDHQPRSAPDPSQGGTP